MRDELTLKQMVEQFEAMLVKKALEAWDWNKSLAARDLGLSRQGLLNKIRRYAIKSEGN